MKITGMIREPPRSAKNCNSSTKTFKNYLFWLKGANFMERLLRCAAYHHEGHESFLHRAATNHDGYERLLQCAARND
ncbi:hypothetical protein [Pedobacter sp. SG918]|uniref:hypothetical protein n=1 Tax=Pedobacter sp. SG918 TaxID=2587136 RepID=UPI00146DC8BC|nr:hypothetical protein [Pedobacter sp. SG918]NMN39408.1 putative component of membrane protein insertase Oxa1/YidC/SpoIIIJ protein YidD [Pedobacter sp. SG918]